MMRLVQFNSGLCVVLKNVPEHSQGYYLTTSVPRHYSSNSSIATTSSSNGSIGINNSHYIHRQFPPTIHHLYNRIKTPSIVIPTSSTVGI